MLQVLKSPNLRWSFLLRPPVAYDLINPSSGTARSGGKGNDTFERYTAVIKDKNGIRMYFHRKSDGAFCKRIYSNQIYRERRALKKDQ